MNLGKNAVELDTYWPFPQQAAFLSATMSSYVGDHSFSPATDGVQYSFEYSGTVVGGGFVLYPLHDANDIAPDA